MKDAFIRVRKSSLYTYMYKVPKISERKNDKPTFQVGKHKEILQSWTIQMKGENETEPSFVHSAAPMNKGKVKDEGEKQFSDIWGLEQNFYNAK